MADARLMDVLERSRRLGFLGPGSVRVHVEHAVGFAAAIEGEPGRFLDLGSGGGVPGLVLALNWTAAGAVLLEAAERRCAFLREAAAGLGIADRVTVVHGRAEDVGRRPGLRGHCDVVVARGFGPPGVAAECGAPFLRVGGTMVVSEPPTDDDADDQTGPVRWPPAGCARVGLAVGQLTTGTFRYQVLVQERLCPPEFPRRVGVPAQRPLF